MSARLEGLKSAYSELKPYTRKILQEQLEKDIKKLKARIKEKRQLIKILKELNND